MFRGIYLLVNTFIVIRILLFSFSLLYFSHVKWKPTNQTNQLIFTFGLSMPNTTWKFNEISDSLYPLYSGAILLVLSMLYKNCSRLISLESIILTHFFYFHIITYLNFNILIYLNLFIIIIIIIIIIIVIIIIIIITIIIIIIFIIYRSFSCTEQTILILPKRYASSK